MQDLFWKILPIFALFFLVLLFSSKAYPKQDYVKIALEEIHNYNGKRIHVTGDLIDITTKQTGLGHIYVTSTLKQGDQKIKVFADFDVVGIAGEKSTVKGIYYKTGQFNGMLNDNYIIADSLKSPWD